MKFSEKHAFGMLIIRGRSDLAYHRDGEKDDNFKIGSIIFSLIPTFRRAPKIERQNTGESFGHDVTNRNIALLQ